MPIDVYQLLGSSPCRAVSLTVGALNLDVNYKNLNYMKQEHLAPEFLKINPQHTLPTIDDNGFYLWESRAILGYLVDKYAKTDSLYPKDAKKRAVVNHRLYFDMGTLYHAFTEYYYPILFLKAEKNAEKFKKVEEAFSYLDKFLEGEKYVAGGSTLTIADLSIAATVSTYEAISFDISKYKNVFSWFSRMKTEIPKYEENNVEPLKVFKAYIDSTKK